MLLASFSLRRPTRDADMLALQVPVSEIETVIGEIAAIRLDDGVTFSTDAISGTVIREDGLYPGIRITIPAGLDRARLRLSVDVSFGDPVNPEPTEIPTLLDDEPIRILGYSIESVIAEKVETMVALGDANTRDRDFADVALLSMMHPIEATELRTALETTARHRGRELRLLSEALSDIGQRRQGSWSALRDRQALLEALPEAFSEVVGLVTGFIDPVLDPEQSGRWNPVARRWE